MAVTITRALARFDHVAGNLRKVADQVDALERSREQQAQRIAELEAESARLRANSMAAAIDALRAEARRTVSVGGNPDTPLRVADWLAQQASQGKKGGE